ncbi:TRAP transporter permease [Amphritea sp. 1_MG-2023]|uniref:TRAP transporter permease n=1 Tax=Amphritea sp. 1_MG-2023 TaxID=3062670 RepID=UPI0026E4223F|nr:TRAP transporter permease [Amphritea sp. 1_MG-2023]MDO6565065.1 TRAP transporter permease [Amphritea sp. 1_MG-2023]
MSRSKLTADEAAESIEGIDDLIAEADTGARNPSNNIVSSLIWWILLSWALFQLWIASPLPYEVGIGVMNDTQTRAIHLAFAVFLAYTAFPAFKRSPRHYIPFADGCLALLATACAAYIWIFYESLSTRPGMPETIDIIIAGVGMVVLLEAARRSLGAPLVFVALFFLSYVFFGSSELLPDVVRWKGASFEKAMSHMWLSTEGVFGVALGVSSGFVFLFVLFGSLLNQAGAGNYFIQIAFSLLGHMRGGPAKAAVISSAMTGLISGSSLANVVTTGTFTIPLMRRVGFSPEKAGAIEASSSVNGVLTPPVMGAVAFLMTEYVGISYVEVVKHAIVPALISYIALVYIVHLEAMKNDMQGLPRNTPIAPWKVRLIRSGIILSSFMILCSLIYYAVLFVKMMLGDLAPVPLTLLVIAGYVGLLKLAAKSPDPELGEDTFKKLPAFADIYKSGIHYIIPMVVLVWFLMVERKSPGFSAFYATLLMAFILFTQKPLKAMFRGSGNIRQQIGVGFKDLCEGMISGSRNMIGIAIATATAGVIVGTVTLTGVGQVMAEFVELLSGGNLFMMLFLVAVISIILGMGLPSTANYIVVSSLMAGVVVELAAQGGLILPLIAVHMFVFYYGIIGDVTPPVGLGSYAAAAISGGDPLKTGFMACFYSMRTAALPFLFVFNTELLLIDVSVPGAIMIFVIGLTAMLLFAAGTMGFFIVRSKRWESATLLLISFTLFRPGFFLDMVDAPYEKIAATQIYEIAAQAPADAQIRVRMAGETIDGNQVESTFLLPLGNKNTDGELRLDQSAGIAFRIEDGHLYTDNLIFGGVAQTSGIDFDWEVLSIEQPKQRIPKEVFYIPAFLLLGFIVLIQRRRRLPIMVQRGDQYV